MRSAFIARFGETAAQVIEKAAREHTVGWFPNPGSDPFRWAVFIALGHECLQKYADYHQFTPDWESVRAWLIEPQQRAWLCAHDGDVDFLALFAGFYDDYVQAAGARQ